VSSFFMALLRRDILTSVAFIQSSYGILKVCPVTLSLSQKKLSAGYNFWV
jgi:hypothetical protein